MNYLRIVKTRAIFPMALILFLITSFLLADSSPSSSSSSSSVQMFKTLTNISVTKEMILFLTWEFWTKFFFNVFCFSTIVLFYLLIFIISKMQLYFL